MRFDDSLSTVLASDTSTAPGREAAWRQLVDLLGRGRVGDVADGVERLAAWREGVPLAVRAASGRALAFAEPPAALVELFAADELTVGAPVLRTATLAADDWLALLPALRPDTRAVLRHRRDLPAAVRRGLESFGATDFVLSHDGCEASIAERAVGPLAEAAPPAVDAPNAEASVAEAPAPETRFEIAELVARIDAFQRTRPEPAATPKTEPDEFHYVTDADGVIRWVEGIARGALIGVSLARSFTQGAVTVGEAAGSALRARAPFGPVALTIGSPTREWRLWGAPRFDRLGKFTGVAGIGRRLPEGGASAADQLRQLVHELRTPANAIAGFAELIGTELLGPAPDHYRDRARLIEREAGAVVAAIDDLDAAARIDGGALELRLGSIDLAVLARRAAADGGGVVQIDAPAPVLARADDRMAERLLARMFALAAAQAAPGEAITAAVSSGRKGAKLRIRVASFQAPAEGDTLLAIAAEPERDGAPLLGVGFTWRLVRALAAAIGGTLEAEPGRLTLRLPAAQA